MQNEYVSSNPLILLILVVVHSFLFDYYYTYTNILSISPLLDSGYLFEIFSW